MDTPELKIISFTPYCISYTSQSAIWCIMGNSAAQLQRVHYNAQTLSKNNDHWHNVKKIKSILCAGSHAVLSAVD